MYESIDAIADFKEDEKCNERIQFVVSKCHDDPFIKKFRLLYEGQVNLVGVGTEDGVEVGAISQLPDIEYDACYEQHKTEYIECMEVSKLKKYATYAKKGTQLLVIQGLNILATVLDTEWDIGTLGPGQAWDQYYFTKYSYSYLENLSTWLPQALTTSSDNSAWGLGQVGDHVVGCTCWLTVTALGGDASKCGDSEYNAESCGQTSNRRLQSENNNLFPNGTISDQIKEARSSIESEMKNMMDPFYDALGIKRSGNGRIRSKCQNVKAKVNNLFNLGPAQMINTKSSKAEHLDAGNSTRNLLGSNDDDALELGMNERFDRLDTNVHSLESKVEKRTASIEESMKSLEDKLDQVEGKLDQVAGIDTKVHSFESKMEKRMSSIEENMKSLEGKLDQVAELLIKLAGDSHLEEA